MKTAIRAFVTTSATSSLVASDMRKDHSGSLVWAFRGLCAMIVVAQLAPATRLMVGGSRD